MSERCPVCFGTGRVHLGFYIGQPPVQTSAGMAMQSCFSCGGIGIVWRDHAYIVPPPYCPYEIRSS